MMIDIDGSILEGGGQVTRMAIGLSALLRKPITIRNIRGGRPKPGLKAQHVCGLHLVQRLAGGHLEGAKLNSSKIIYKPDETVHESEADQVFDCDIGTAGATTLLAQVALPVALFRHQTITLELKGGTHTDFAPPADYYQSVFLKALANCYGIDQQHVQCQVVKRGYFPQGGGLLRLKIAPINSLKAMSIVDHGQLLSIGVHASTAGKVPQNVAHQMASGACHVLSSARYSKNINISVDTQYFDQEKAFGNGSSVLCKATVTALRFTSCSSGSSDQATKAATECFLAGSAVGNKNRSTDHDPSDFGKKAAQMLLTDLEKQVCFDQHLQDQMIIFMALAQGRSRILTSRPLTLHTKTAIYIAELMTQAKFNVEDINENQSIIECQGIGYTNQIKAGGGL